MKKILGLDLGTNSIGWALVKQNFDEKKGKILGMGSRIIPMDAAMIGEFEKGNKVSQTADRTKFRSVRRLRERALLRRERLHRVLNILGFLPSHYAEQIDFEKHFGQFKQETEPKLVYKHDSKTGKADFLFKKSFEEMLADFAIHQPELVCNDKKVPYDWTIYYLRKKALEKKIEKEELAWLLLHFNQKRGYFQLQGEDDEVTENKIKEYYSLLVIKVEASNEKKGKDEVWYNVHLENGWIYRRSSKTPLEWTGKIKEVGVFRTVQ
jgi:CRISPR-associated endonuclease Csn1